VRLLQQVYHMVQHELQHLQHLNVQHRLLVTLRQRQLVAVEGRAVCSVEIAVTAVKMTVVVFIVFLRLFISVSGENKRTIGRPKVD